MTAKIAKIKISYRNKIHPDNRIIVKDSKDAYHLLLKSWNKNYIQIVEEAKLLMLDKRNACLGVADLFRGGTASCIIDPKIVLATSLVSGASGIILAHNHPSGNLKPSKSDIDITRTISNGASIVGLRLLDHMIITPHGFYSMLDKGLLEG